MCVNKLKNASSKISKFQNPFILGGIVTNMYQSKLNHQNICFGFPDYAKKKYDQCFDGLLKIILKLIFFLVLRNNKD